VRAWVAAAQVRTADGGSAGTSVIAAVLSRSASACSSIRVSPWASV
jgi:hypothetical protein